MTSCRRTILCGLSGRGLNEALKRMEVVFTRVYESDAKGARLCIAPRKSRRTGALLCTPATC